jgi:hypothetical protein
MSFFKKRKRGKNKPIPNDQSFDLLFNNLEKNNNIDNDVFLENIVNLDYEKQDIIYRKILNLEITKKISQQICEDSVIKHGNFKGVKILNSSPSHILGSYETEISLKIKDIINTDYSTIIDVGCSSGYYTTGFAVKCPNTEVWGFDINQNLINSAKENAKINNVKINFGEFCSEETLLNFNFKSKSLIMSDCEGFEKTLLTERLAQKLEGHDFLVELHDFLDRSISNNIILKFNKTHHIELLTSITDIKKTIIYDYPELFNIPLFIKWSLLSERRPEIMQWVFIKSKK